ncbi:MAG: hypothetical protein ACRDSL_16635 [Pseudonocardiaceae bacterium]
MTQALPREQAAAARRAPVRRLADREGFLAWAMLLPAVVYIVLVVAVPFALAVAFAFSDVTAGDPSPDRIVAPREPTR